MTNIIKQAVYPLLFICSMSGLGVYAHRKTYLHIFYNVIIWICYSCLLHYIVTTFKLEKLFIDSFYLCVTGCNILTCIASAILNIFYNKTFMKRLAAVDCTLAELGTAKTHHKLHAYVKGILIIWLICYLTTNVCDRVRWIRKSNNNCWAILTAFVVNHTFHVTTSVDILFSSLLWYIGTRFDKINEHMKCLLIREERDLRCTWRRPATVICPYMMCDNYKHIFWTSIHLHLELCQLARELNTLFGTHVTLEMMNYLMALSTLVVHCFMRIKEHVFRPMYLLNALVWLLLYIARLFFLNYTCEIVSAKANNMGTIVHHMTQVFQYADIRNEIQYFILQIIHRSVKFTGLGFFNFGYSLLQNFFSRSVAIVLFGVQGHRTEIIEKL